MSERPSVEILLPFYGDLGLFRQSVESVVRQDDPRWRLTIIEDGDLHGSDPERWVESLADERISFRRNPAHLGVAGSFQHLLDLASGDYLTFLGCDDILLPHYVRTVSSLATRFPTADVLHPSVHVIDEHGAPFTPIADRVKRLLAPRRRRPGLLEGEALAASLLHGNWAYFPAMSWKAAAIRPLGFRQDLPTTLDLELLMKVLIPGGRMAVDPTVAFLYRRHAASASSSTARTGERFLEEDRLFSEIAGHARAVGWHRAARAADLHVTSRLHRLVTA